MSENKSGTIAAIQTSSGDDVAENLNKVDKYLSQASQTGSRVVVLPECFGFIQSSKSQLLQQAEQEGRGQIQDFLAESSSKYGIWIIAGSLPLKSSDPEKVSNTLLVYDDSGACVERYDKIFLFDISLATGESYCESNYTQAGNDSAVVSTPVGEIGLSICYDLRFPELFRRLSSAGAQILVVPSAFSYTTGRDHWMPLLRARAIENSCYVVAAAQYGLHNSESRNKRMTWGHTVIIDPWGGIITELDTGWGVISADINLTRLEDIRRQLSSLQHRRSDIFPV